MYIHIQYRNNLLCCQCDSCTSMPLESNMERLAKAGGHPHTYIHIYVYIHTTLDALCIFMNKCICVCACTSATVKLSSTSLRLCLPQRNICADKVNVKLN